MDNKKLSQNEIDELLIENKEILNGLILEQNNKKDKIYTSYKELDIICNFERNLIKLIEKCPPNVLKELQIETDCQFSSSFDLV